MKGVATLRLRIIKQSEEKEEGKRHQRDKEVISDPRIQRTEPTETDEPG